MKKVLVLILLVYVAYSQYLISGYEAVNDKLNRVNDMLLHTCTTSKFESNEGDPYR